MALLMVSTEAIIQVLWITGPVTTSLWISAPMPCLPDAEALPVGSRCAARIWIDNRAVVSVEDDPPQVLVGELSATDLDAVRRYIALNRSAIPLCRRMSSARSHYNLPPAPAVPGAAQAPP